MEHRYYKLEMFAGTKKCFPLFHRTNSVQGVYAWADDILYNCENDLPPYTIDKAVVSIWEDSTPDANTRGYSPIDWWVTDLGWTYGVDDVITR